MSRPQIFSGVRSGLPPRVRIGNVAVVFNQCRRQAAQVRPPQRPRDTKAKIDIGSSLKFVVERGIEVGAVGLLAAPRHINSFSDAVLDTQTEREKIVAKNREAIADVGVENVFRDLW